MADLGSIGVSGGVQARIAHVVPGWAMPPYLRKAVGGALARRLPVWAESSTYGLLTADLSGHFSGIVTQETVPVGGHQVTLFWREPIKRIASVISAADGSFSFTDLIPGTDNYFLVILDKDGGIVQNMLAFDKVTPV